MSAGGVLALPAEPTIIVIKAIDRLAPLMQSAMREALAEMERDGVEAELHETERSHVTAVTYYKRGRPPTKEYPGPVTNAPDETYTWHGYRLAGDIIHRRLKWSAPRAWFRRMADVAKRYDMKAGLDWTRPDAPHVQWHRCRPSPSDRARALLHQFGVTRVWLEVGAIALDEYDALVRRAA